MPASVCRILLPADLDKVVLQKLAAEAMAPDAGVPELYRLPSNDQAMSPPIAAR